MRPNPLDEETLEDAAHPLVEDEAERLAADGNVLGHVPETPRLSAF
jgi:hypothetical protein